MAADQSACSSATVCCATDVTINNNDDDDDDNNNNNRVFHSKLGRKLAGQSGDDREISFLFQRLSVLIQRYNAILLHDCFVEEQEEE